MSTSLKLTPQMGLRTAQRTLSRLLTAEGVGSDVCEWGALEPADNCTAGGTLRVRILDPSGPVSGPPALLEVVGGPRGYTGRLVSDGAVFTVPLSSVSRETVGRALATFRLWPEADQACWDLVDGHVVPAGPDLAVVNGDLYRGRSVVARFDHRGRILDLYRDSNPAATPGPKSTRLVPLDPREFRRPFRRAKVTATFRELHRIFSAA